MIYERPPVFVPATAEYVLDVFRDWHRQRGAFDWDTEPDAKLTFETTVAEWRSACDLLGWKALAQAFHDEWSLDRPLAEWQSVLEPADTRTLRDVCEFIASGAVRPAIEALSILGSNCLPAGAFLTIRWLLREAGVKVDSLTPSTPLGEYTRHHLGAFLGPISRLAPNVLPTVKVSTPCQDLICAACLVGMLITIVGLLISPVLTTAGMFLTLSSWAGCWMTAEWPPPSRVEFGNLQTFGDLARAVAEGAQPDGRPVNRAPSPS